MVSVPIRVLIINHQLSFSVRIKQSLEQTGQFEVTSFTSASAAIEHLQERSYQVALVDFDLGQMSGAEIVKRLRAIQLDIAIIASPQTEQIAAQAAALHLNGIVDVPCTARELIPVLEAAVNQLHENLEDTSESPTREDTDTRIIQQPPDFSSLDSVLFRMGGLTPSDGTETLDIDPASSEESSRSIELILSGKHSALREEEPDLEDSRATEIFNRLAAEEPPVPDLENNGTISDLITSVGKTNLDQVADVMMHQQDTEETHTAHPNNDGGDENTAKIILRSALDDSASLELSLAELLNNVERQFPENEQGIEPLPSWLNDFKRFVSEPDFLQMSLPDVEEFYDASMDTTLMVNTDEIEASPGDIETEFIEPPSLRPEIPPPPPGIPGMPVDVGFTDEDEPEPVDEADFNTDKVVSIPPTGEVEDMDAADAMSDLLERPHPADTRSVAELPPYNFDAEDEIPEPEADSALQDQAAELLPPYEFGESPISVDLEPSQSQEQPAKQAQVAELPPYEFDDPLSDSARIESVQHRTGESNTVKTSSQLTTVGTDSENPQIAKIALMLTQISLELTAEATILLKDREIVAYAGPMPLEDIEELQDELLEGWDANPGESRIRFITLAGSGQDYMLFSRRTAGDYVLSMIFAGNMPLRVIRRQSKRLLEAIQSVSAIAVAEAQALPLLPGTDINALEKEAALEEQAALESTQQLQAIQEYSQQNTPETAIQTKPQETKKPVQRTAYTYVWLIGDPERPLTPSVAEAIVNTLDDRLEDRGWEIKTLHVFEDYVYLFADIPVDDIDKQSINELKQISGEIAHRADDSFKPDKLWDDSYFVLAPGRELHQDEIQEYISFARD